MDWILLGVVVILGFYMAWNIGANDVANSMADAVGSRSISIRNAVILAGIFEFLGAVLVGAHVTDTIRKGIVDPSLLAGEPELLAVGMAAALLSAAVWLHLASYFGLPVSTTHSIVGAVAGFGLAAAGAQAIYWGRLGQIVLSWFISPVAGGLMAYLLFRMIIWTILGRERPARAAVRFAPWIVGFVIFVMLLVTIDKGLRNIHERLGWLADNRLLVSSAMGILAGAVWKRLLERALAGKHTRPIHDQLEAVERAFAPVVVLSSCSVAFSHGANDVANAVGPLAAVVDILQTGVVRLEEAVPVPFWVLMLGGLGIVTGLATYGYRVMLTVGTKITQLTPSRGIAADVAAATAVLVCSRLGLPVSTTHTLVGAIMGVGFARGLGSVDRTVAKNIFGGWLITVPITAVLSMLLFAIGRFFLP